MAEVQKAKIKQNPDGAEEATVTRLPNSRSTLSADGGDTFSTEEKVVFGIFGAIMASVIGFSVWFGVKDEKERQKRIAEAEEERKRNKEARQAKEAEIKTWREESRNDGFIVLELKEGILVAVPAEAYKESRFKETR